MRTLPLATVWLLAFAVRGPLSLAERRATAPRAQVAMTFGAAEIADTETPDVHAEWSGLLQVLSVFDFGVLLGLAAFGLVMSAGEWRRLWIVYALAATYALSVAAFYVPSAFARSASADTRKP